MDLGEHLTAWRMPLGYSAGYQPCEYGMYWHLYLGAERVNGGISRSEIDARRDAARNAWLHRGEVTGRDDEVLLAWLSVFS